MAASKPDIAAAAIANLDALTARWQARRDAAWFNAPLPRRWHRCKAHQCAIAGGRLVERCACGATRINGIRWIKRNSRRK